MSCGAYATLMGVSSLLHFSRACGVYHVVLCGAYAMVHVAICSFNNMLTSNLCTLYMYHVVHTSYIYGGACGDKLVPNSFYRIMMCMHTCIHNIWLC